MLLLAGLMLFLVGFVAELIVSQGERLAEVGAPAARAGGGALKEENERNHPFRFDRDAVASHRDTPQSFDELPGTRLVAVADVRESRAHNVSRAGIMPNRSPITVTCSTRQDVDVVSICVPSGLHAEVALAALRRGQARHRREAHRALAGRRRPHDRGRADGEAQAVRGSAEPLQPAHARPANRVVESGRLGRLLLGNATVRWYRPQEYYEDGWHGTWAMDGGALMNQSIHHIDALQWLLGRPESVFAYTATLAHRMEAEDVGVATIRFRGGTLGVVEAPP